MYATPVLAPDQKRQREDAGRLRHAPIVLDADARAIVRDTIEAHARLRNWIILEFNVRSNHVHVVVEAAMDPDAMMSQFKAWSTRRLRDAAWIGSKEPVWTEGGSTKYIWNDASLARVLHYVRHEQGPEN